MKRVLFLALAIVLMSSLLLVACSETTPAPTQAPEPAPGPAATQAPEPAPGPAPTQTPAPAPIKPGEVIELNFAYYAPPPSGMAKNCIVPWADALEAACGGRIDIIHHGGGALLTSADSFDGVLSGICDLAQVSSEETPGRLPRSGINTLPLLYPNIEVSAVSFHEYLLKYAADTELKGVQLMITLPVPPLEYFGNKELRVLEDLKGQKMKASGMVDAKVVEALGATAVVMGTSDMYSSLDTGLLDSVFFSFDGGIAFAFIDVTKYVVECDVYNGVFQIQMNKNTYNNLPDDIKKIVDDFSTPETSRKFAADFMATIPAAKEGVEYRLEKAGKPPIYVIPEEEMARWKTAMMPVWDWWIEEMDKDGLDGKGLLDDYLEIIAKNTK